ncbi:MAG: KH domain-containing protein [Clostridia bacterium]
MCEPVLVRLGDVFEEKEKPKEWECYVEELGIDSRNYDKFFMPKGYPWVEKIQKGIIRELKKLGHEIYDSRNISYDKVCVAPSGSPEEEIEAELFEVWLVDGGIDRVEEYRTEEVGKYIGPAYSKEQIEDTQADIEKVIRQLDKREIVSKIEDTFNYSKSTRNFEGICDSLDLNEGELVWAILEKTRGKAMGSTTLGLMKVSSSDGQFILENPFCFPTFSADKQELYNEIKSNGQFELIHHGRSGFASRNYWEIKPFEKPKEYNVKVINEFYPGPGGDSRFMIGEKDITVNDYSLEDVEKAKEVLQKAIENQTLKSEARFLNEFKQVSVDGVFAIIVQGGNEEEYVIPEGQFLEGFRARKKNTKDYRLNMGHTEAVGYIDIARAEESLKNGKIHMAVPEEYMGIMIGKGGQNINRIQEKLVDMGVSDSRIKVILHPQLKEKSNIKLEEIDSAIQKEKNKEIGGEIID